MVKKSFVNTPAARMLAGSVQEENKVVEEKKVTEEVTVSVPEVNQNVPAVAKQTENNEVQKDEVVPAKKVDNKEQEPMTKVLIEMSLMDSYKINNIVNAMKLRNKGKYTKKQFYAEMIEDAIAKFEKELGL